MPTTKQRHIDGLRAMADFIEASDLDDTANYSFSDCYIFCKDSKQFADNLRALGTCKKSSAGNYVNATRTFGRLRLQVTAHHDAVCERVKTGERVIAAKPQVVIAAKPEEILPAEEERVEEIFEWKCPESFLALSKQEIEESVSE